MDIVPNTKTVEAWRRNPATVNAPSGIDDFIKRSNEYFEECADLNTRPTITGYVLAVGLPGPTSLIRLGQRIPQLRYAISRCMMAIAAGYEDMIGFGNAAGPMFMLKNIPDFDPDEPIGSPSVQFFNDRKEILLQSNITGIARSDAEHDKEDPLETYIRLVRQRGYLPGDDQVQTTVIKQYPQDDKRRSLTIITEGWEDE